MADDEVQEGLKRAASVLGQAKLVVGAVARNRFSRRLLQKNQGTLRTQAGVLRELAGALDMLADELPRDYRTTNG